MIDILATIGGAFLLIAVLGLARDWRGPARLREQARLAHIGNMATLRVADAAHDELLHRAGANHEALRHLDALRADRDAAYLAMRDFLVNDKEGK